MKRLLVLMLALSLTGCLAPKYHRPNLPVPPSWPTGDAYSKLAASDASLPSVPYTQIMRDLRLQTIIAQALKNNRDLRASVANIAAAREKYRIQHAQLFPEIDANSAYHHTYSGATAGKTGAGGAAPAPNGNNYALQANVPSYEVDLFGRVRSLTSAAKERYFEAGATADATRLTLIGEIATAWLTYASDRSLLDIDQKTAESGRATVKLTQDRFNAGIAGREDIDQAQQIQFNAEASAAQDTTQVAQDVNALQLLVGAPVDSALLPASIDDALSTIGDAPPGLSSTILLRRPDVIAAEDELRATNAEIGAARAELFPTITLTGLGGFASNALTSLFSGGAFAWSAGANANWPIFRAGAGRAYVRFSEAQRDASVATYENAIQSAFRDVSDALARRGTIDTQMTAQNAALKSAQDYYATSYTRYSHGVDTFLQTLDAQRTLLTAQKTLIALELIKGTNRVTLYQSLGGDASLNTYTSGVRHP